MNGEILVTVAGSAFMIFGAVIMVTAAIGLVKLPDVYTRTSAVGTAAGLGVALMIVGVVVLDFSALNLLKGVVAIIAQLITSAIGSFILARASYMTGEKPVDRTSPDQLAEQASANKQ